MTEVKVDFHGQVVLVTGATRGIGRQLAQDFASLGAQLVMTGTKRPSTEELHAITRKGKGTLLGFHEVDFTDQEHVRVFLRELAKYEKIDVAVNNAGINRISRIHESRVEDWDDILSVNLKAPYLITRVVSRTMKRHGYGRIINISSIFGLISREKRSIYSSSKSGLLGLTVASSNELARYNVLVNAVSPGFVLTDLTKRILSKAEMSKLAAQIPVRRLATSDEISHVVVFLASGYNTYITGQNIIVDGGYVNV